MSDMLKKAYELADYGHKDQKRKYTGEPYINHCEEAVSIAKHFTDDEILLSALYCHDLLEDTTIKEETILNVLGQEVLDIVIELTQVSKPEDGNRAVRKKIDIDFLSTVSKRAQTAKCFDLISNCESITTHDRKFALVYLKETDEILNVLTKVDKHILDMIKGYIDMCWNKILVSNNILHTPNENNITNSRIFWLNCYGPLNDSVMPTIIP